MRLAALACLALAIAACGHADPPPPPLTGGPAPEARPATPSPSVAWRDRAIAITGLPAIAGDGSSVIVAHRDSDGGRGNPNLTLIERSRDDRVIGRLLVITATEVDQLDPAAIARRFDAAARWLDERHTARHLVAMTALEAHPPTDEAPATATGRGITLRWVPGEVVIELTGAPRLARPTPPSWLAADRPLCATCTEVCHNDAFLGGGHVDLARRVAVVVVSYRGTDTCWEPGSQAHVVAW